MKRDKRNISLFMKSWYYHRALSTHITITLKIQARIHILYHFLFSGPWKTPIRSISSSQTWLYDSLVSFWKIDSYASHKIRLPLVSLAPLYKRIPDGGLTGHCLLSGGKVKLDCELLPQPLHYSQAVLWREQLGLCLWNLQAEWEA